jgi:hypothetical protein
MMRLRLLSRAYAGTPLSKIHRFIHFVAAPAFLGYRNDAAPALAPQH